MAQMRKTTAAAGTYLSPALFRGNVLLTVHPHLQHPRGFLEVHQSKRGSSLSPAFGLFYLALERGFVSRERERESDSEAGGNTVCQTQQTALTTLDECRMLQHVLRKKTFQTDHFIKGILDYLNNTLTNKACFRLPSVTHTAPPLSTPREHACLLFGAPERNLRRPCWPLEGTWMRESPVRASERLRTNGGYTVRGRRKGVGIKCYRHAEDNLYRCPERLTLIGSRKALA